jgi:hypothetical protein
MIRHHALLPALVLIAATAVSAQVTPPAGAKRTVAASDSLRAGAPSRSDTAHRVLINREVFTYDAGGRRDPFNSLMNTSELRPLLTELKLVAVAYDPVGGNSVAVLRDLTSKEQYRVRVGQTLGRMRVAAIHEKEVVFTIEEFGFSRQETLSMVDTTKTRVLR